MRKPKGREVIANRNRQVMFNVIKRSRLLKQHDLKPVTREELEQLMKEKSKTSGNS